MPVTAPQDALAFHDHTGMRRRRAYSGAVTQQPECFQTSKPRLTDAMEDTRDKWTVVAEYPTTSGMATDAEEYMRANGLCMDEKHVGSPTDLHHMWRLVHEWRHSMYWNCPMNWLHGCPAEIRIVETHNSLRLDKTGSHDGDSHRHVRKKAAMSARTTSHEVAGIKPPYPGDGFSSSDSGGGGSSSDDSRAKIRCVLLLSVGSVRTICCI